MILNFYNTKAYLLQFFFIPEIALYALDVYYNQTYLQTSSKKKFLDLDNIYWQKCWPSCWPWTLWINPWLGEKIVASWLTEVRNCVRSDVGKLVTRHQRPCMKCQWMSESDSHIWNQSVLCCLNPNNHRDNLNETNNLVISGWYLTIWELITH